VSRAILDAVTQRAAPAGTWFAVVAIVEAITWAGLLVGMYLKHVADATDLGVTVFGRLHGAAFLVYVVVAAVAAVRLRWRPGTIVLAMIAAVPPLATVPLEIWMRRTGRLVRRADAPAPEAVASLR